MNTEPERLTKIQAAELAGVSMRTITRWTQRGVLPVYRPHGPWGPAEYDREEVLRAALRKTIDLPLPE